MARRSNGEGSFYQQKDKSWVYQVTYGRKEDGSPYRKAFKGRTKTICKERRAQWGGRVWPGILQDGRIPLPVLLPPP